MKKKKKNCKTCKWLEYDDSFKDTGYCKYALPIWIGLRSRVIMRDVYNKFYHVGDKVSNAIISCPTYQQQEVEPCDS